MSQKLALALAARPMVDPLPTETPELLALGAEIEPKLQAYRAAAERLRKARATAESLWPMVPEEIVTTRDDRQLYDGCHDREMDVDGEDVWPPDYVGADGKTYGRPPRRLFKAEPLKKFVIEHGIGSRTSWGRQLRPIIAASEKYETACAEAIEITGVEDAKDAVRRSAYDLQDLARAIGEYAPTTVGGIFIRARALAAYSEAEEHTYSGKGKAGALLGLELADAVLRLAPGGSLAN